MSKTWQLNLSENQFVRKGTVAQDGLEHSLNFSPLDRHRDRRTAGYNWLGDVWPLRSYLSPSPIVRDGTLTWGTSKVPKLVLLVNTTAHFLTLGLHGSSSLALHITASPKTPCAENTWAKMEWHRRGLREVSRFPLVRKRKGRRISHRKTVGVSHEIRGKAGLCILPALRNKTCMTAPLLLCCMRPLSPAQAYIGCDMKVPNRNIAGGTQTGCARKTPIET